MLWDVLQFLRTPIVAMDLEFTVYFANLAAQRLLSEPEGPAVVNGRLKFPWLLAERRFHTACAALHSDVTRTQQPLTRVMRMDRRSSKPDLMLALHSRPSWSAAGTGHPSMLLVLADTEARTDAAQILCSLNGFTPSEVAVVQRLLDGERPGEIAAHMNLAPETVRVHIKRVFKKCGVHSQSQLVRLVAQQAFTLLPFYPE